MLRNDVWLGSIPPEQWRTPVIVLPMHFAHVFVCMRVCMLVSMFVTCGQQVTWRLDTFCENSRNFCTREWPTWPISVSFALILSSACLPPLDMLMAHIIFPFISPKKKNKKPCLASLISACHLMRSLLFIFLFVRREGEKHINKAQANPTTLLDGKGLPHLWQKGCLTGI